MRGGGREKWRRKAEVAEEDGGHGEKEAGRMESRRLSCVRVGRISLVAGGDGFW